MELLSGQMFCPEARGIWEELDKKRCPRRVYRPMTSGCHTQWWGIRSDDSLKERSISGGVGEGW